MVMPRKDTNTTPQLSVRSSTEKMNEKKGQTRYVWLHVLPDDIWLRVPRGQTIRKALQPTAVELGGDCGGQGKCGKCKVKVLSEIGEPSDEGKKLLDKAELEQGIRLACRTKVNGDMVISTSEAAVEEKYFKILTTSHHLATTYIPIAKLDPLIDKRFITLPAGVQSGALSNLDSIKRELEADYQDLKAPLHTLRRLRQRLEETLFQGTAVLHEHCLLDWQDREQVNRRYGLAFDIGTSTLVGKLFNLVDGSEVAVTSCLNSQSKYGSDVISRLQYCQQHPAGVKSLHQLLTKDLNQIIDHLLEAAGLQPDDIFIAVAAGNTTMQHFLLGLSPVGIAEAPFSPVLTDGLIVNAVEAGLRLHMAALLYTMPVKSGYIGGDLLSVVMTSGAGEQQDEIMLGLDLGTNGEIFLGNGKRLLTCSAAAGPALEGARITYGMIARAGAIDGVTFEDGHLHYRVIGNIKPEGICGSGLVDLIAVLLQCDIIDHEGLIRPSKSKAASSLNSRIINHAGVNDFLIASVEESYNRRPVYLTQKDVREFQVAKGAIATGIKVLMDDMDIGVQDIHHVYLAGALGNYVEPFSAMRTGLIPRVNPDIIKSLGNAASTGASMVLLAKSRWQTVARLVQFIEHVELSYRSDFNQNFVDNLDFPQENLW